jgi:hypothetical protein
VSEVLNIAHCVQFVIRYPCIAVKTFSVDTLSRLVTTRLVSYWIIVGNKFHVEYDDVHSENESDLIVYQNLGNFPAVVITFPSIVSLQRGCLNA